MKIKGFILGLLMLVLLYPQPVQAQTKTVKVNLPTFKIEINGIRIDNDSRQYPFIIYNDISYFPLTYYDTRFLGLITQWDASKGLSVDKVPTLTAYEPYKVEKSNAFTNTATYPTFDIHINGEHIDNANRDYPFLLYKGVTYVPMTWQLMHDAFGWNYSFDNQYLTISTETNGKIIDLQKPINPIAKPQIMGDKVYFLDDEMNIGIYDTQNVSLKTLAWDNKPSPDQGIFQMLLEPIEDQMTLHFYSGGGFMGSELFYDIREDDIVFTGAGKYQVIDLDGEVITIDYGLPPFTGNLYLGKPLESPIHVESDSVYFGWTAVLDDNGTESFNQVPVKPFLFDNTLYILGTCHTLSGFESALYRVDQETVMHWIASVKTYTLMGDTLFYEDNIGVYYKVDMKTFERETITLPFVGQFTLSHGLLWGINTDTHMFTAWQNDGFKSLFSVLDQGQVDIQGNYFVVTEKNKDGLSVYDASGQVVFQTDESILGYNISSDSLLLQFERLETHLLVYKL